MNSLSYLTKPKKKKPVASTKSPEEENDPGTRVSIRALIRTHHSRHPNLYLAGTTYEPHKTRFPMKMNSNGSTLILRSVVGLWQLLLILMLSACKGSEIRLMRISLTNHSPLLTISENNTTKKCLQANICCSSLNRIKQAAVEALKV